MVAEERLSAVFDALRAEFRGKDRKNFLTDIEGQILDDEEIFEAVGHRRLPSAPYVMVTFDRKPNDAAFSYAHADLILVALDRIAGGSGIFRPLGQLRVLRWNASETALVVVLRAFARANSTLKFSRILVMPYPSPPAGHRLDPKIYQR